jgi:chromosome segregation ATPase
LESVARSCSKSNGTKVADLARRLSVLESQNWPPKTDLCKSPEQLKATELSPVQLQKKATELQTRSEPLEDSIFGSSFRANDREVQRRLAELESLMEDAAASASQAATDIDLLKASLRQVSGDVSLLSRARESDNEANACSFGDLRQWVDENLDLVRALIAEVRQQNCAGKDAQVLAPRQRALAVLERGTRSSAMASLTEWFADPNQKRPGRPSRELIRAAARELLGDEPSPQLRHGGASSDELGRDQ